MPVIQDERFDLLRAREYSRLDREGHVYLDYTGSGLYAESLVRDQAVFLEHTVLGNPHSESPASARATAIVETARHDVLDFFGADPAEYVVVFTANASAALKLIGEAYPFGGRSRFALAQDNHNSVQGIRAYAERRGAEVVNLPLDRDLRLDGGEVPPAGEDPSLFAYPAQSNFSGVQHPLDLMRGARAAGYDVLLDAAAYVPTNRLDLSEGLADFVCVSFYKMFGFPTGVGALVARREALGRLERPWFAGGTVEFVSVQNHIHQLRIGAEAFEDGTPNFLSIASVTPGLAFVRSVGIDEIHDHVAQLTARLLEILTSLHHANGRPAVELYGPRDVSRRGGTVALNFLDPDGHVVRYAVVERAAAAAGISLRGGCFCNPGAAEAAFGMSADETLRCLHMMPRGSFTLDGFAACLMSEVAVGAIRISLGLASNARDLDRLQAFLEAFTASDQASVSTAAAGVSKVAPRS